METISTPQSYKCDGTPESPYLRARAEWDERIGAVVVQAKNWRICGFLSLALVLVLSAANLLQISQHKVIPMVVEVDKVSGEASIVGKAGGTTYQPGENQIKYFLLQFVKLVRTVPSDPVVIKSNWLAAYKFLTGEAATTLNLITNQDESSPLKKIGTRTVSMQPISALYIAGSNSYQVRWSETVYSLTGEQIERYLMSALFTIDVELPTTEEEILINPLGIRIKSFSWDKEIKEKR